MMRAGAASTERSPRHIEIVEQMIADPGFDHVSFDISWDEVAKYATASPEAVQVTAALLNRHPERFLFGTDVVAPASVDALVAVYDMYAPVWALLTPEARHQVTKGNYERLFDRARTRVRAWESVNLQTRSTP